MKKKIIKFLVDKARQNKLIQSVFEQPLNLNQLPVEGTFTDKHGNKHNIYKGYRTKVKPNWERIFDQSRTFDKSIQNLNKIAQKGRIAIERIAPIMDLYTKGIENSRVLEFGCAVGGSTFALAEKNPKEIIGTEFSGYKIEQFDNQKEIKEKDLIEVNDSLKEYRNLVKGRYNINNTKVSFVDDDICNSRLEQNSFDIICSWEVLEHIHDPLSAFKGIYSLLNDNGVAVHEHNPFFGLNGGHSASTIDFPWGHVILDNEDYVRYSEEVQPDRKEIAVSYYQSGLNRMTIKDLENYCAEANLKVSLIKFPREQHLRMMNKNILELCKKNYPTLELEDLVTPRIIVIMQKAS